MDLSDVKTEPSAALTPRGNRAQPPTVLADNLGMNLPPAGDADADLVYAVLWIGALLAAANRIVDPFPDHLVGVAAVYFQCVPPRAKA